MGMLRSTDSTRKIDPGGQYRVRRRSAMSGVRGVGGLRLGLGLGSGGELGLVVGIALVAVNSR